MLAAVDDAASAGVDAAAMECEVEADDATMLAPAVCCARPRPAEVGRTPAGGEGDTALIVCGAGWESNMKAKLSNAWFVSAVRSPHPQSPQDRCEHHRSDEEDRCLRPLFLAPRHHAPSQSAPLRVALTR